MRLGRIQPGPETTLPPAFSPFWRRLDPLLAEEDTNCVFEAYRRRRELHGWPNGKNDPMRCQGVLMRRWRWPISVLVASVPLLIVQRPQGGGMLAVALVLMIGTVAIGMIRSRDRFRSPLLPFSDLRTLVPIGACPREIVVAEYLGLKQLHAYVLPAVVLAVIAIHGQFLRFCWTRCSSAATFFAAVSFVMYPRLLVLADAIGSSFHLGRMEGVFKVWDELSHVKSKRWTLKVWALMQGIMALVLISPFFVLVYFADVLLVGLRGLLMSTSPHVQLAWLFLAALCLLHPLVLDPVIRSLRRHARRKLERVQEQAPYAINLLHHGLMPHDPDGIAWARATYPSGLGKGTQG
ncbi:MAG: hypothetical protein KF858_09350 [Candidatus Sumerlaeia bacterium]|nr:hypothetical protein [Candidatus Sumerlaeia bacterium]